MVDLQLQVVGEDERLVAVVDLEEGLVLEEVVGEGEDHRGR